MTVKTYTIKYAYSSRNDIKGIKQYILKTFKYRTYLFFYVVDDEANVVTLLHALQDGMNWKSIINRWLKENV